MMTRTCSVRQHVRKLPPRKCGIDNAIHRRLQSEVRDMRLMESELAGHLAVELTTLFPDRKQADRVRESM